MLDRVAQAGLSLARLPGFAVLLSMNRRAILAGTLSNPASAGVFIAA